MKSLNTLSFRLNILAVAILSALGNNIALADTTTPIKHLIVVVGENVSFDTLYGTYMPAKNQSILNLVSQGIVNADGTPGPKYNKAVQ
ncbi:MAG TPA: phosphoesterase, partial [Methylophilaceae bacterium]|nr:phosphoesterase [Methylophilaceae bacterium]